MKYKPMFALKMKRIKKGLTQGELGKLIGVSQNAISAYEVGAKFPRRNTLDKLAKALGCSASDLV